MIAAGVRRAQVPLPVAEAGLRSEGPSSAAVHADVQRRPLTARAIARRSSQMAARARPVPVRLQRSRAKGSRLVSPNGLPVVCVSRPSKWGNPFPFDATSSMEKQRLRAASVERFEYELLHGGRKLAFTVEDVRRDLRDKNLACWCPLDEPCHADVLLTVARGTR